MTVIKVICHAYQTTKCSVKIKQNNLISYPIKRPHASIAILSHRRVPQLFSLNTFLIVVAQGVVGVGDILYIVKLIDA
jgi:hypothetical protein